MQDTWFSFAFALVVSIALLYLPGLYFARLFNVRKFLGFAIAPVISIACVAFLGIVFGYLGIKWSVYKLVFAVLLLGGLVFLGKNISHYIWDCFKKNTRRLAKHQGYKTFDKDKDFGSLKEKLETRRAKVTRQSSFTTKNVSIAPKTELSNIELSNIGQPTDATIENKISKTRDLISWNEIRLPLVLALVSGIVTFVRSMWSLQIPNAISQSPDGHYRYNNVANMLETGDVSSLHMLELPPNEGFYPAAWHDFVTTVIHVTGVQIPTAANAFTYFILCFVWPVSMLAFATCVSRNKVFLCLVAVFVNCYSYFPLFYLSGGILYANIVAASILPMILCVVVAFLFRLEYFSFPQSVVLGLTSLVALVFSQPNTVFVVYYFVLIVLPFAGWFLGKDFDRKVSRDLSAANSKDSG